MNTNRQQNLAKSVKRYRIIAWIAVLICLLIIGKVVYVGTLKREYWMKVAEQKKVKEKPEPAERGNILSCDGRLLSGTLPEYDLIIDFSVCQEWRDSMWRADFPKICAGLHRIFPDKSEGCAFDMQNGCFVDWAPQQRGFLTGDDATKMQTLMRMNYDNMRLFKMSHADRNRCLDVITDYYRLHVADFREMKSLSILRELFA